MTLLYVAGCIIFIVLQGFFAASEISFISSNSLKLRHRKDEGDLIASQIYQWLMNPEKFLATTLIGTNIAVVLSSSFLTLALIRLGIQESNVWTTILFTPVVVIFAELIPKNIGRHFQEDFSCRVVGVTGFFEKAFSPVVKIIEVASKFLVKTFIGKVRKRSPFVTKVELRSLVTEMEKEGGIDRGERQAIEEIFEFKQSKIKDICVPLKKVVVLDYADTYGRVMDIIRGGGHTRYPVFRNREIAGYLNIYDVFYNPTKDWRQNIRPITRVGFNQNLYEIFTTLRAKKESIALVLKGKKAYGIITLQDSMKEIITSIVQ